MKVAAQIVSVSMVALLQVFVLPISFALLLVIYLINKDEKAGLVLTIFVGCLIVSIFGNLGFGVALFSLSGAAFAYLLLTRVLPERRVPKILAIIFCLIFWEVMLRTSSALISTIV